MVQNVQLEELSSIKRKLTIELSAQAVAAALDASFQKVQQKAELKGFRKGKVPRPMIEKYYAGELRTEAVDTLVQQSYPEAVKQVAQVPIARPQITIGELQAQQSFTYEAIFEVRPHVQVEKQQYSGFQLTQTETVIAEEEIDRQVQVLRQSLTQLQPLEASAGIATGMVARIDFVGTVDGKAFDGGTAKDFVVDVGGGNLLPIFEQQLLGMQVGEQRAIEFRYPDDYFNLSLAGSQAKFTVDLKELKKKVLPELNDDFAKSVGSHRTLADLRQAVRAQIQALRDREVKASFSEQIMTQLLERHPLEVPEAMVGWELSAMYERVEQRARAEQKTLAELGITPEGFIREHEALARDRVRGYLLLDAIAEAEGFAVGDDEVERRLQEISDAAGETLPKVRLYYEQRQLIPALKAELLHEKCLDFAIKHSKIKIEKAKTAQKESK